MKVEREPGTDAPSVDALITLEEIKRHLEIDLDEEIVDNSDAGITLAVSTNRTVTGVGTQFKSHSYWQEGLSIIIGTRNYTIESIESETSLTVEDSPSASVSATSNWKLVLLGDHTQDAILKDLIAGVTANLDAPDGIIGRSLGEQTLRMTMNGFPRGKHSIRLRYPPVRGIVSIKYDAEGMEEIANAEGNTTLAVDTNGVVTGGGSVPPDFESEDRWAVGRSLTVDGIVFYIKEITDSTHLAVTEGHALAVAATSDWILGVEHLMLPERYNRWDDYGYEYVIPSYSYTWPATKTGTPNTVRIVYEAGEADVPQPLKIAGRMMLTNLYERRDEVVPARIAVLLKNPAIDRLMNPYNMTGPDD